MSDVPPTTTPPTPAPTSATAPPEPYWAKPSIGIFSLIIFAGALGVVWWAGKDQAFNLLIGAVIANATTVIGYYFGSSSGSAQKTALLAAAPPPGAGG
jgi:hypothetical protein